MFSKTHYSASILARIKPASYDNSLFSLREVPQCLPHCIGGETMNRYYTRDEEWNKENLAERPGPAIAASGCPLDQTCVIALDYDCYARRRAKMRSIRAGV